ncbi:MAG TPA: hypothetical protein DG754_07320 [Bacteroidales bacterium]|jgi:hypothetical protein|nr:hypothetical protein [Bacteroidales bacterium]
MKTPSDILKSINPQYFWDVDFSKLDPLKSKRLIIERVFALGTSKEIGHILEFYGRDIVLNELKNLKYLDPKTLNFISLFFNAPLQSFKCYTRKQSMTQHWNF